MDEPLSNLDAKLRVEMRAELSKLHKELDTTFVYVTHDQTEAMTMGTRICIMYDGDIQQVDDPQTIYDSPSNKFVAEFIGSPQMNIIDSEIIEENGKIYAKIYDSMLELNLEKAEKVREKGYIGKEVVLRVDPDIDVQVGQDIEFSFRAEKVHLFDKETELNICE
jgi:multiple sugar transport system ATP-binding protein